MEETSKQPKNNQYDENIIAALAYIIFFLPLILTPKSKLGRYHATQGFNLFLYFLVVNIFLSIIPIVGWILLPFALLFGIVLLVMGFSNAYKGLKKPLPVIGSYKIVQF